MGADHADLIRRVERRCWAGLVGANLTSALALFPAVIFLWPIFFGPVPIGHSLALACAAGIPYLAFGTLSARHLIVRPLLRRCTRWLLNGNAPTADEIQQLAMQPRRQANGILCYWVVFPFWALPYAVVVVGVPFRALTTVKFLVGFGYLAFMAWTLSYLFVRAHRSVRCSGCPSRARRTVSRGRWECSDDSSSHGSCPRACPSAPWSWCSSRLTDDERLRAIPWLYFISGACLVAGIIATVVASRAITDPLEKVRAGMRAVERGELDVDVPVDEASEIGVLQMGFNRMAIGLRERERMREIFGHHVGAGRRDQSDRERVPARRRARRGDSDVRGHDRRRRSSRRSGHRTRWSPS